MQQTAKVAVVLRLESVPQTARIAVVEVTHVCLQESQQQSSKRAVVLSCFKCIFSRIFAANSRGQLF